SAAVRPRVLELARRIRAVAFPLSARLDRRSVRLTGADRFIYRSFALCAELAVLGFQSGLRSFRAGVFSYLRTAYHHDELLEQLRTVSVSREADSADDPQCAGRQAAAPLCRRSERARLAVCR